MYQFIILLSFLFVTGNTQPDSSVLSVTVEGSVELPADIIQFDVNLNAERETPEGAYQLHKQREESLVTLLDKYDVKEADINFQPVSITKSRNHIRPNEEQITYVTSQLVRLTLSDFDSYEKIQVGLIKYGFDNFSGYFLSSEEDEGREQALRNAIQTAKKKARLIAEETGITLGAISRIHFNNRQVRPVKVQAQSLMMAEHSSDQLMKYDQTIVLTASIQVDFQIVDQSSRQTSQGRLNSQNQE